MSAKNKHDAEEKIANSLQTKINKEVRSTLLDVAHCEKLRLLNCEHLTRSVVPASKMVHCLKPTMDKLMGTHHAIKVGDYVEVLCEYAPGTCSDGGIGYIMSMDTDEDGHVFSTVSYVLDSRIETKIECNRITVTPMPYKDVAASTRSKNAVAATNQVELMPDRVYAVPERSPLEWLKYGLSTRTHEKRGWLREKLLHHNLLEPNDESLWKRILSDYKCQLSAIEGMRLALGAKFVDPREHKGTNGEFGKYVSMKSASQIDVPKNMWTIPYILHAYDVKRSNFQNKRNQDKKGAAMLTQKEKKQYNKGDCVITNRAASRRMYNAKYFFARKKSLSGIVPVFKGEPHRFLPIDTEGGEFVFRRREWQLYPTRVPIISFICLMLHVAHVSNKYCCELVCVLEPGLRCMGSWGL
jgi:hypothetical protein